MNQTKKQIVENYIRKIVRRTLTEAKQAPDLPNTNLQLRGFGMSGKGNAIVKLSFFDGTNFTIQTNGNLPETDSLLRRTKVAQLSNQNLQTIADEVVGYISNYGTKTQKQKLKVWGN